ncbi:MAG: hypothetical protein Aurels2KO_08360 [Aureliella sp.]
MSDVARSSGLAGEVQRCVKAWSSIVLVIAWALVIPALAASYGRAADETSVDPQEAPAEFAQLDVSVVTAKKWAGAAVESAPLLIHFHGAAETTESNFLNAHLPGVLVTVNCRGLSSAYRRPFDNERLFAYLIQDAKRKLVAGGKLKSGGAFSSIGLSCFSAGYGAVREILKQPASVKRVQYVVAADSIYASIHRDGQRRVVDKRQMQPFLDFARLAVREKKTFVVSHSQLPVEPYASTVETADYLLRELGCNRAPVAKVSSGTFATIASARLGRFLIRSYPGNTGESHLQHLRNIGELWKTAVTVDAQ